MGRWGWVWQGPVHHGWLEYQLFLQEKDLLIIANKPSIHLSILYCNKVSSDKTSCPPQLLGIIWRWTTSFGVTTIKSNWTAHATSCQIAGRNQVSLRSQKRLHVVLSRQKGRLMKQVVFLVFSFFGCTYCDGEEVEMASPEQGGRFLLPASPSLGALSFPIVCTYVHSSIPKGLRVFRINKWNTGHKRCQESQCAFSHLPINYVPLRWDDDGFGMVMWNWNGHNRTPVFKNIETNSSKMRVSVSQCGRLVCRVWFWSRPGARLESVFPTKRYDTTTQTMSLMTTTTQMMPLMATTIQTMLLMTTTTQMISLMMTTKLPGWQYWR